ncbi:H-2 class II histocompatibility antigen, E-S beta chain-like [Salarias fasciatus]|uniref:H-2 class II histocompatibility antigen, E-S beta chain-like n=1 Tax=Salarias fasciatus TaxID=181472 RepID=A0A672G7K3_SALFA|nr:H-2 class II histocompatibility antigen, E-S beta chain-like [Salarias fasciatus]
MQAPSLSSPVPWLLFLLFSPADSYFGNAVVRCQFNSTRDVVFLEQLFFNKVFLGEYNSMLGKYVGYTEKMRKITEEFNKSKGFLERARKNQKQCEDNRELVYDVMLTPAEPSVTLRSVEAAGTSHPGMLVCSAYDFYPKNIKLTWLRNGHEVTSDVTSTEELSNGNWLYQIHSHLEIDPSPGDKITCKVEHASLMEPKLYEWELVTTSDKNKIAAGTAGIVLGLVFLFPGVIFYRRRNNGHQPVPTNPGTQ